MLWHDDVTDEAECVLSAHFIKFAHKTVAGFSGFEQRAPTETAECDEVEVTFSVTAL